MPRYSNTSGPQRYILVIVLGLFWALMVEQQTLIWAIIGAIGVLVTLGYLVIQDIVRGFRGRRRRKQLQEPCEIHFLILRKDQGILDYVRQDDDEHQVDELVLPSQSTVSVGIWIKPKLTFHQTDWYFGCAGISAEKPKAVSYYNPLITQGIARENRPEVDRRHYVDIHGYYHIVEDRDRIPSEVYVTGFVVETKGVGTFEAQVLTHTPEQLGRSTFRIRVEDPPVTRMRCIGHKNCYVEPMATKEPPNAPA